MKKILIPISVLFATQLFYSQTSTLTNTENYVYSKTILDYDANNQPTKTSETVQYFDGLGRAKQIVNVRVSPLGKDVVTHLEYDGFGRQTKDFLPISQSGTQNGGIYSSPLSNASAQYGSEKIYAEKVLENSPLDRIQQQIQVGNDWISKPVKFAYDANETNEVRKYTTLTTTVENRTNSVLKVADDVNSLNGFYKTSQLYKSSVKDEDGNETIEFKNGEGQTVLVRKMLDNTTSADTYYVYNEYNQLAFVIPPKASETLKTIMPGSQAADAVLNNLCYQYRYDGRNRLVEKKLPGKGWEFMVYDKQDRLVLSQDAVLGTTANNFTKKGWMFTKYDQFGRVVYIGFFANTASRNSMQTAINNMNANSGNNETRSTTAFNLNGMDVYYTKNAFPTGSMTILGVNYYDTYPNGTPTIPTQILEQDVLSQDAQSSNISTKSLPVASYVKNIEDDNWTKNYTWYDTKGRAIGSHSINHLGGYTKTESELDFAGVTKQAITRHKRLDSDTEKVITETFTYDNQNRLKTHTHQIDNNPIEYLAQNEYNELSQLQNKKVGGTNAATPLQSIDYEYNIRGWMTKINDPNNLGNDLFGYRIKYNQVEGQVTPNTDFTDLIVKPKYNGNIAEVDWKTSTSSPDYLRRYGYVYDGLNRLKAGFYQREDNPTAKEYFEKTDYDLNGNITSLKRSSSKGTNASASLIDNLIYTYNGNQLNTVTDSSSDYNGYPDTSGIVISYDLNGNMKNHVDKGIENINYNSLNLPNYFLFNYGLPTRGGVIRNNIQYLYKADGTKLRKIYNFAPPNPMGTATELSTEITDYIDGFQYKGNGVGKGKFTALLFYPTAEGYFNFENNKYIYNYNDHLGNVRLSYFKNDNNSIEVLEENNYYPFGLKHEGYNVLAGNPSYKYKYQGQELQETGFYSFKWRNYMPDVGRFFNIDPLAEKFPYNSTYAFAENRVIDGRELEGLEWVSSRNLETKTVNLHLTYKPVNNTVGALSNAQMSALLKDREAQIVSSFGGKDSAGNQVNITFSQSDKSTMVWDYNIAYDTNNVDDFKGVDESGSYLIQTTTNGMTDNNENTQTNRTQINVYTTTGLGADDEGYVKFDNKGRSDVAKTGAHETGHTLGIKHNDKATLKSTPDNLMREGGPGTKITPEQRSNAIKLVEEQQPKTR